MKHIVVDLEMNRLAKEYKQQHLITHNEVIEFGAVMLDENYQEIDSFKRYVKPQFNECVIESTSKLTQITWNHLKDAQEFPTVLKEFIAWCQATDDEVQFYEWSESDLTQLLKEIKLKDIVLQETEQALFEQWHDLQKEFDETVCFDKNISLKDALEIAGLEVIGYLHDAFYDAKNTAAILRILHVPELKRKLYPAIEAMQTKDLGIALSDMIDLTVFQMIA